jgi:ribosomal protein S5
MIIRDFNTKTTLVFTRFVSHGATGGRKNSVIAAVILSKKPGLLSIAYGKASNLMLAKKKAINKGMKNFQDFSMLSNEKIFNHTFKYKSLKFFCSSRKSISANWISEICLSAISLNMTIKVFGSRHPKNMLDGTIALFLDLKKRILINNTRLNSYNIGKEQ